MPLILAACGLFAVSTITSFTGQNRPHVKNNVSQKQEGFAVLELFTSEGCSSCPPADELMAKLQQESGGKPMYILAYHVDYWNRLGWKDTFSSAGFSARQEQYAHWLNSSQVYTPQVVINGRSQFVGSDERSIRHQISEQLETKSSTTLDLQVDQHEDSCRFQYQATYAPEDCYVEIAILQKAAQSIVTRGENAGHTLSHVQIVRSFQTWPLSPEGKGNGSLAYPHGLHPEECVVFGLIQNRNNGEILAIARAHPGNRPTSPGR